MKQYILMALVTFTTLTNSSIVIASERYNCQAEVKIQTSSLERANGVFIETVLYEGTYNKKFKIKAKSLTKAKLKALTQCYKKLAFDQVYDGQTYNNFYSIEFLNPSQSESYVRTLQTCGTVTGSTLEADLAKISCK